MTCPSCQGESADGARFCAACGTPLAPGGDPGATGNGAVELRLVSVLFVDLVGFTPLAERHEDGDVRELLGRYFTVARTVVTRHGGVVQKFIGDAVMAVWGLPQAREDDAERAVRAALAMIDEVGALGAEAGADGLRARVGVVTGQAATAENPDEGLVVGDRVNTAARAQAVAAPGTVLVDEVTRQVAAAAIEFADGGVHALKGKSQPVRLWRAVRPLAGTDTLGHAGALDPPFLGRDSELWLAAELFHGAVARRSGRLLFVSGDAGIGKSRLRRELARYLDQLPEVVLWHVGRCLAPGDGVAQWALAEMVRQRLGIAEDAPAGEAQDRLAAGLELWIPDPADRTFLGPRLGALLAIEDPGLDREDLFAGWRLFFAALAEQAPVVLAFENLQWADSALLSFIDSLLEWSAHSPIFVLALARPEGALADGRWPPARRGVATVRLEPLDEPSMRSLLNALVDGLPGASADAILDRAQGVPLYAVETVRALADRGVLRERAGRLSCAGSVGEIAVAPTLGALLAARLDALEPEERGLVQAMSVFGSAFSRATAAALGGLDDSVLDAVLASLVRKRVLTIRTDRLSPDRGHYVFAQQLLRAAAYETLSRRERLPRHVAAAEHLRTTFADDGEDVAELIAAHYLDAYRAAGSDAAAGELRARALEATRRAARRTEAVGAPEAAERAYLAAADLTDRDEDRIELIRAAGRVAVQSGRHEAAITLLDSAAESYRTAGRVREAARIAGDVGRPLVRLGRLQESVDRQRAALSELGADELDPDVAQLNSQLALALLFLGDYEQAEPALERALEVSEALDLSAELSEALSLKALLYKRTGRIRQARHLWLAAIEIAERQQLHQSLTLARTNLGNLGVLWDMADADAQTAAALALARRRGQRLLESLNGANLMMVNVLAGRWSDAHRLAAELLPDDEARPAGEAVQFVVAVLALLEGECDAAAAALRRMADWEHAEEEEGRACFAAIALSLDACERRHEQALTRGTALLSHALGTLGANHESVRQAWPETIRAALALGRRRDAERVLAMLAEQPSGAVPPYLGAQLVRARGLIESASAPGAAAETHLRQAVDGFRGLGYPYWRAVAQTDLAAWLIERGRGEEAASLLDAAIGSLRSLGAAPALDRALELAAGAAVAEVG